MAIFAHETILPVPLIQLWQMLQDPVQYLPRLAPSTWAVLVEKADLPLKDGSRIVLWFRDPLNRKTRWEAQIQDFHPPRPVVFGFEARFTEVQVAGPFAIWKHAHELEAVDSQTTRMVDRITYRLAFGLPGLLADTPLRWQFGRIFAHRDRAMRKILGIQ